MHKISIKDEQYFTRKRRYLENAAENSNYSCKFYMCSGTLTRVTCICAVKQKAFTK